MYCTQCGCKIEEEFKFCPGCGCSVMQGNPADNRSELDRIADEIFWKAPGDIVGCAKYLAGDAGISIQDAKQMIIIRYKEWKRGKKSGKYPDTEFCPNCASREIENFHKSGIVITRQSSAFKSMVISSQTDGVDMLQCQRCGIKWIPKKKK